MDFDHDAMDPNDPGVRARRMAGENAADLLNTRAELRARLDRIEALLGYLTAKLLTGEPLAASDEPVLRFFGISNKNPDPLKRIRERTAVQLGKKIGVVECPSCGSNVHDVEGVFEETCSFCGATVTTRR